MLASPAIAGEIACKDIRGAKALWYFNEGTGTNADDICGNFDATLTGGIWSSHEIPASGYSYKLTGTNGDGGLAADPLAAFPDNAPKTLFVVYKPFIITTGGQNLIGQSDGTNANTLLLFHRLIDNGQVAAQAGMSPDITCTINPTRTVAANEAHLFLVTASTVDTNGGGVAGNYKGINLWIDRNGIMELVGSSVTANWQGSSGNVGLGRAANVTTNVARGAIPAAGVIQGVLSKGEIQKLYDGLFKAGAFSER